MTALSIALVVVAALAWDGWRRWVIVRALRLDERLKHFETAARRLDQIESDVDGMRASGGKLEERVRDLGNRLALSNGGARRG